MPDPAQPRRVYLLLAKLLIILSITSYVGALFLPGFDDAARVCAAAESSVVTQFARDT